MINRSIALKAIADKTRMELLTMLLKNNCCVRALARRLGISEATASQHLKVLREAGLLTREKRGHFTHYTVERIALQELADEIEALAAIKRIACAPKNTGCQSSEQEICHAENPKCRCRCGSI